MVTDGQSVGTIDVVSRQYDLRVYYIQYIPLKRYSDSLALQLSSSHLSDPSTNMLT